jgi:hypothetical protein
MANRRNNFAGVTKQLEQVAAVHSARAAEYPQAYSKLRQLKGGQTVIVDGGDLGVIQRVYVGGNADGVDVMIGGECFVVGIEGMHHISGDFDAPDSIGALAAQSDIDAIRPLVEALHRDFANAGIVVRRSASLPMEDAEERKWSARIAWCDMSAAALLCHIETMKRGSVSVETLRAIRYDVAGYREGLTETMGRWGLGAAHE